MSDEDEARNEPGGRGETASEPHVEQVPPTRSKLPLVGIGVLLVLTLALVIALVVAAIVAA